MKSGLRCLKSLNGPVHLQDLLVQRREALGDAAPAQLCCVWCWVLLGRVQDEGAALQRLVISLERTNPVDLLKYWEK